MEIDEECRWRLMKKGIGRDRWRRVLMKIDEDD